MLSGALLLKQDKELIPFLKNRFQRIVLPFLFWSLIYCFVFIIVSWKQNTFTEIIDLSGNIFKDILFFKGVFKQQAFHFWYVYMIIGLFLIVSIIRKWIKAASEKEILHFLCIWLLTILFEIKILESV